MNREQEALLRSFAACLLAGLASGRPVRPLAADRDTDVAAEAKGASVRSVRKIRRRWRYSDGGRAAAGYRGKGRDCVARALAIAMQLPYAEVYKALANGNASERGCREHERRQRYRAYDNEYGFPYEYAEYVEIAARPAGRRTAKHGIWTTRAWFRRWMNARGWIWTPMRGRPVRLRDAKLPRGRLIVESWRHAVAVIDGVAHDSLDPRGMPVRGYWYSLAEVLRNAPRFGG
jgi:hypothetical protein